MIAYTNYATEGRARIESETLVNWGYEVVFLVPKMSRKPDTKIVAGVTVKELNVLKYRGNSSFRYLLSYFAFLGLAFLACTRLFFRSRIDVVHVHNLPDFLVFAGLLPRLFGRRLILDIHDSIPETYMVKFGTNSRLFFILLKLEETICCGLAHKIVCVNHVQRDVLVKRGIPSGKIATILSVPGFVPQEAFANNRRPEDAFRMVYHGTISKRLGVDLLVQAVARLASDIPGLEFHVYGEGDYLEEVLRLGKSLGVANQIHFHGVLPWELLPKELAAMDVGVVGNRRSAASDLMLPVKLIDFVVLGIPAVVPRLPAIEYYFSPQMVSFYDPENVEGIADAIMRLYRDKARREGQKQSAKAFLDKYRWDSHQSALRELYNVL
jgi:glycosyltransferase involved in cell wall biosynthesis